MAELFGTLMDHRTDKLRQDVEQRLASEASKAAHSAAGWVEQAIYNAYQAGVSDGFAQGVQAESENRDTQAREGER